MSSGTPALAAIDEPEKHMHPELLYRLIGILEQSSAERQIIVTKNSEHTPAPPRCHGRHGAGKRAGLALARVPRSLPPRALVRPTSRFHTGATPSSPRSATPRPALGAIAAWEPRSRVRGSWGDGSERVVLALWASAGPVARGDRKERRRGMYREAGRRGGQRILISLSPPRLLVSL